MSAEGDAKKRLAAQAALNTWPMARSSASAPALRSILFIEALIPYRNTAFGRRSFQFQRLHSKADRRRNHRT